jgi:hypothetical protein
VGARRVVAPEARCYRDVVRRGLRILAALLLAVIVTPAWAHGPAGLTSRIDRPEVAVAPGASAPSPGPAGRTPSEEWAVARPGAATSGAVETLAVLVVALGLTGLARSWRRDRRAAIASAAAGLLLGFVVATTPHLVHHSLDADQGAGCQALQAAERCHAAVGGLDAALGEVCAPLDEPSAFVAGPTLFAPAPCRRAPPA